MPIADRKKCGRKYRIVVGVDNSPGAQAALEWAADEAAMRDGELVIVHALDPIFHSRAPYAPAPEDEEMARQIAVREVDKIVTTVLSDRCRQKAQRRYVVDLPARALVSACVDADLLVVGTDRQNGDSVGATPRACLHTAVCPTAVVPAPVG